MKRCFSRSTYLRPACLTAIVMLAIAIACARPKRPSAQQVREILARGAPYSESSFYACLLNYYEQGLPLKQIQDECETKLALDDKKGFGERGAGLTGPFTRTSTWFDPSSVTASCNAGDPNIASGVERNQTWHQSPHDMEYRFWGWNSWGGAGQCGAGFCYRGLTEAQSTEAKLNAIREAELAFAKWQAADEESKADPSDQEKSDNAARLKEEAIKAFQKAFADPNRAYPDDAAKMGAGKMGPGGTGDEKGGGKTDDSKGKNVPAPSPNVARPSGPNGTPCSEALQTAREVVGECQRTGWRNGPCQSLWAKLNKCADPELIYVDPESGYACGTKIDPQLLKDAYVERCRRLKRPTPGGPDPCVPPSVDALGRYATGSPQDDICNNPYARIDPDSPECLGTLTIQSFAPNVQHILVWGLNKLGGPIVFIPDRDPAPPPSGGPEPRPGPRPNR